MTLPMDSYKKIEFWHQTSIKIYHNTYIKVLSCNTITSKYGRNTYNMALTNKKKDIVKSADQVSKFHMNIMLEGGIFYK